MPTTEEREALLAEAYVRGILPEDKISDYETAVREGYISAPDYAVQYMEDPKRMVDMPIAGQTPTEARAGELAIQAADVRRQVMQETMEDIGPIQAFTIGMGKGFTDVGRGLPTETQEGMFGDIGAGARAYKGVELPAEREGGPTLEEQEAMARLEQKYPVAVPMGEITGESLPFLPTGMGAEMALSKAGLTGAANVAARMGTGTILGGAEGAILAEDPGEGALVGGTIGAGLAGAEVLFPVIGRLGGKIFRRVTGTVPKGAMLDAAGRPTQELQGALEKAGMTFEDLTEDAQSVISQQMPGADPEQVARKAMFTEEGIPLTKGELTQGFEQQALEQQLLKSTQEKAAEPLRQFKLDQSEAIKKNLSDNMGLEFSQEETGEFIKKALVDKKSLLRTQKNELYEQAAQNAKEVGQVPVFTDSISEALPDDATMRRIGILDSEGVKKVDDWLMEYGVKDPTPEMLEAGFEPSMLTLENFDEFRVGLNQIAQGSDAIKNVTGPITRALDSEVDNLAENLAGKGLPDNIVAPLKEARATVRQMKTEFDPKATVGQLTDLKKNSMEQVTESSKVYNKLTSKALPVESTRKVIKSLRAAGEEGKSALGALQSTTMLDLIDAGFGTQSRKIDGVKVFNPIAFKNRIKNIGQDKINAIFADNKQVLKSLKNIDKIAADITPTADAVPKGSAPIIQDLMNKLGFATIGAKIPVLGPAVLQTVQGAADSYAAGKSVKEALNAVPETARISGYLEETFPGIASAMGIATITDNNIMEGENVQ